MSQIQSTLVDRFGQERTPACYTILCRDTLSTADFLDRALRIGDA
jgi:hypothetical protein